MSKEEKRFSRTKSFLILGTFICVSVAVIQTVISSKSKHTSSSIHMRAYGIKNIASVLPSEFANGKYKLKDYFSYSGIKKQVDENTIATLKIKDVNDQEGSATVYLVVSKAYVDNEIVEDATIAEYFYNKFSNTKKNTSGLIKFAWHKPQNTLSLNKINQENLRSYFNYKIKNGVTYDSKYTLEIASKDLDKKTLTLNLIAENAFEKGSVVSNKKLISQTFSNFFDPEKTSTATINVKKTKKEQLAALLPSALNETNIATYFTFENVTNLPKDASWSWKVKDRNDEKGTVTLVLKASKSFLEGKLITRPREIAHLVYEDFFINPNFATITIKEGLETNELLPSTITNQNLNQYFEYKLRNEEFNNLTYTLVKVDSDDLYGTITLKLVASQGMLDNNSEDPISLNEVQFYHFKRLEIFQNFALTINEAAIKKLAQQHFNNQQLKATLERARDKQKYVTISHPEAIERIEIEALSENSIKFIVHLYNNLHFQNPHLIISDLKYRTVNADPFFVLATINEEAIKKEAQKFINTQHLANYLHDLSQLEAEKYFSNVSPRGIIKKMEAFGSKNENILKINYYLNPGFYFQDSFNKSQKRSITMRNLELKKFLEPKIVNLSWNKAMIIEKAKTMYGKEELIAWLNDYQNFKSILNSEQFENLIRVEAREINKIDTQKVENTIQIDIIPKLNFVASTKYLLLKDLPFKEENNENVIFKPQNNLATKAQNFLSVELLVNHINLLDSYQEYFTNSDKINALWATKISENAIKIEILAKLGFKSWQTTFTFDKLQFQESSQSTNQINLEINKDFIATLTSQVTDLNSLISVLEITDFKKIIKNYHDTIAYLWIEQHSNENKLTISAQAKEGKSFNDGSKIIKTTFAIETDFGSKKINLRVDEIKKFMNFTHHIDDFLHLINIASPSSYLFSNQKNYIKSVQAYKLSKKRFTLKIRTEDNQLITKNLAYQKSLQKINYQFLNPQFPEFTLRKLILQKATNIDEAVKQIKALEPNKLFAKFIKDHQAQAAGLKLLLKVDKINQRTLKISLVPSAKIAFIEPQNYTLIMSNLRFKKMQGYDQNGFRLFEKPQYNNLEYNPTIINELDKSLIPYNIDEKKLANLLHLPSSLDQVYFFTDIKKNNQLGTITLNTYRRDYSWKETSENKFVMIFKHTLLKSLTLEGFATMAEKTIMKERTVRVFVGTNNFFLQNEDIKNNLRALDFQEYSDLNNHFINTGTAFVLDKELNSEKPTYYLATNKHVFAEIPSLSHTTEKSDNHALPNWNYIDRIINRRINLENEPQGNQYYNWNFKGMISFGNLEGQNLAQTPYELQEKYYDHIISIEAIADFSQKFRANHGFNGHSANFNRYFNNLRSQKSVDFFDNLDKKGRSALDLIIFKVVFASEAKDPFKTWWDLRPTQIKSVDESQLGRTNHYDFAHLYEHNKIEYGQNIQLEAKLLTGGYPHKSDQQNENHSNLFYRMIQGRGFFTKHFEADDGFFNYLYEKRLDLEGNQALNSFGASGSPIFDNNLNIQGILSILYIARDQNGFNINHPQSLNGANLFSIELNRNLVEINSSLKINNQRLPYYNRHFEINAYDYLFNQNFSYWSQMQKFNPQAQSFLTNKHFAS